MLPIGLVIVTLGIIGIAWGIFQKVKAGRVADAPLVPTGEAGRRGREVAGPKGQISAQGGLVCPQPLIAPFSGTPCVYYSIKCTAEWKDGDSNKSKVLDEQKVAAQFSIDDGSGPVFVDAREGGDFEPTQKKSETKGTGILGGITGTELVFGNYRVQTGMLAMGTKYSVEEEVMPLVPTMYACGKVAEQGNAIAAPGWRSLILSAKSRDELLGAATKGAKMFLFGGGGAFVIGSALAIIGQVTAGGDEAPTHAASAAASASAPAASVAAAPVPPPSAPADPAPAASAPPATKAGAPATKKTPAAPKATGAAKAVPKK